MIEERQRLVRGKRRQPQRQPCDLHSGRIEIHSEQATLRDLAPQRNAVRRGDVRAMPLAIAHERLLGCFRELQARRHQKRAAAHRGVENAQSQNVFSAFSGKQRPQRLANDVRRQRARRVEGARRFANVPRARQPPCNRLVIEHLLVHGAELLDVEVAVDDAAASGGSTWRRRADRQHRFRHHVIVNCVTLERTSAGR